ncbi:3-hydroxypropanoate dehydrogenase [Sediminihabitans luteus]|uniref:3-hydroxypropanoate dehydrogenase n=1 Tax=Sediminihabitans luteus TaxID=1138585 RepID=A0A2M9CZ40_9CELL|nr:malonic semialdehyde reductase [Sediminihabitans luteus]PJJ77211.1 3-hydroxypropanoate dehydrogenase [Sediminihabitans luteus]
MSTDILAPAVDAPHDDLLTIDPETADLLFREARTVVRFDDGDVSDAQVQAAYDLVRWGPTMMNTLPLRLLLVRTPEARERLAAHMNEGNRAKTLAAPLTIVAAADPAFHERMDVLAPHMPGAHDMFEGYGVDGRADVAQQSALIQIGYLVVGLRAAGLHAGPMGGFDKDGVDAEFFAENGWRSQLVINVGTPAAEGASYPRQARLSFDEVSTAV